MLLTLIASFALLAALPVLRLSKGVKLFFSALAIEPKAFSPPRPYAPTPSRCFPSSFPLLRFYSSLTASALMMR